MERTEEGNKVKLAASTLGFVPAVCIFVPFSFALSVTLLKQKESLVHTLAPVSQ